MEQWVLHPGYLSGQAGKLESALQSAKRSSTDSQKSALHLNVPTVYCKKETQAPKVK